MQEVMAGRQRVAGAKCEERVSFTCRNALGWSHNNF
jgi:hypothetical protein